jgi:hypothetical protein
MGNPLITFFFIVTWHGLFGVLFYSLFGVEWVMPNSVLDLLSGWGTLLGRDPINRIWKQVPLCVLSGL